MTKICIVADSHYGARSDNQNFYDYQKKFWDNVLFPTIRKYKCGAFIHLGDLVDNRRALNLNTARRLHKDFLEPLDNVGIPCYFILGNHDILNKETKSINVFQEVIHNNNYKNFQTACMHFDVIIGGKKFLLLPWILPKEREKLIEVIKNSDAEICMSHLELKGFEQTKGRLATHGDDHSIFSRFSKVFSGHYHTRSVRDNVFYIGSSFQFNWGDCDNYSGCVILDTESGEVLEIPNPYSMFNNIEYDEDKKPKFDVNMKDSYVKVNVVNKKSEAKFNKFIETIHEVGVADLQINENLPPLIVSKKPIKANSTLEIFRDTISALDFHDKDMLQSLTEEIYQEAILIT